nr:hypothetical protein [Tanacetum cinerariifolium]
MLDLTDVHWSLDFSRIHSWIFTNQISCGSASRRAQQIEPAVGQDGLGGSGGGAIIGFSAGQGGAGVASQGGNNGEASGSASRRAQQIEPAVGQDGLGGSGGGAIIGFSAGQGGAGVAS